MRADKERCRRPLPDDQVDLVVERFRMLADGTRGADPVGTDRAGAVGQRARRRGGQARPVGVDGVRTVDELRIRWIEHTLRAEAAITVNPQLTLAAAHDIAHHAEAHLLTGVRRLTAATVHASPAGGHRLIDLGAAPLE